MALTTDVLAIVSADAEWRALREVLGAGPDGSTPFGEYIEASTEAGDSEHSLVYFQGGYMLGAGSALRRFRRRWHLTLEFGTYEGSGGRL